MESEKPLKDIVEEPVTDYAQLDLEGTYSYVDYMRWHFKERVELIRGKVFKMSPAPNANHQGILMNISMKYAAYFDKHPCRVYFAPFDVRLPTTKPGKDYTVVQPDLCVICDESKLDKQGCKDAPDLIVEILSPGNSKYEMQTKYELYQEAGIKEYWIVEPEKKIVLVYSLQNTIYIGLRPFTEGDTVESVLFPELRITADDIFARLL